jgi:hypothetical protein
MKYFNFYSEEYPYTFGPVGQKKILLTGFGTNKGGSCVVAKIRVEENEYKVAIPDKKYF